MNSGIYHFKRFELARHDYALHDEERERRHLHNHIGSWDIVTMDGDV